jgi:signal transduction histidine kinase
LPGQSIEATRLAAIGAPADLVAGDYGAEARETRYVTADLESRIRALVDAGIAMTAELSLDGVLQKIVEAAADLTGARYAALGVIDRERRGLERFLTTGLDPETYAAIGELPRGRGILGALIQDAEPLRLRRIADDPRSVGFPPNHPPMHTFLGVPVLLRGVAYGNLYLTEKEGGEEFTEADQELVQLLAAQAAVAIENARLYESATRWLRQLESLIEVSDALSTEIDLGRLLNLVCERVRELVDARLVLVALPRADGRLRIAAAAGDDQLAGAELPEQSKLGRVLERRRSERVDSIIDDLEVDQETARRIGAATGLYVPLLTRDRAIGVLAAHDKLGPDARFNDEDLRLVETFARRAALAADLSERVARDALRRVMSAQELERRRLARELHDETGQALTSVLLGLRAVEDAASDDERRESLAALRELAVATLQDVRRLAVELRPKALDDFGLVPALDRLTATFAEQTGITVQLEHTLGEERLPPELETTLYRIAQEALTNVVKHARASRVSVVVTRKPGAVSVLIEDDGRGFAADEVQLDGFGLMGMRERLELLEGRLTIESSERGGTTIAAEVPVH